MEIRGGLRLHSRVPTRGCRRLDGAKADPRDLQTQRGLMRRAVSAAMESLSLVVYGGLLLGGLDFFFLF